MKYFASLALLSLVFAAGCLRRYDITLTNQRVITSHGKPKEDKTNGVYRFKDAEGKPRTVPVFQVREIAPH